MDDNNKELKYCEHCGQLIAKNAKVCPHCGGRFKKGHTGCLIVIAVVAVILLLCYGCMLNIANEPLLSGDELTMSESEYKEACKSADYDILARQGDSLVGEKLKIKGKLFIDFGEDGGGSSKYEVETIPDDYLGYMDGTIIVYYTNTTGSKLLEEDIITIYGEGGGTDSRGNPIIHAAYIERNN